MVDFTVLYIKSAFIDRKLTAYDFSYLLSKCIVAAVTCLAEKLDLDDTAVLVSSLEPKVFLVLKVNHKPAFAFTDKRNSLTEFFFESDFFFFRYFN